MPNEFGSLVGDHEFRPTVMFDPEFREAFLSGLTRLVGYYTGHLITSSPTKDVDKHFVERFFVEYD